MGGLRAVPGTAARPRSGRRWAERVRERTRRSWAALAHGRPWAARVREHRWFLGVLALGAALRVVTMLGYRPALWFPDSYTYVVTALKLRPDLVRPAGYPVFLRLLEPFHSFAVVSLAQHLLGLLTGALVYLTARRLRAAGWAAALASVPVLLDAYQIELEHLLVSDTLFTVLVVAAACLAVSPAWDGVRPAGSACCSRRRRSPGPSACPWWRSSRPG
nr:hypothetical protein GCM10020093_092560 [Planobispora longispora]